MITASAARTPPRRRPLRRTPAPRPVWSNVRLPGSARRTMRPRTFALPRAAGCAPAADRWQSAHGRAASQLASRSANRRDDWAVPRPHSDLTPVQTATTFRSGRVRSPGIDTCADVRRAQSWACPPSSAAAILRGVSYPEHPGPVSNRISRFRGFRIRIRLRHASQAPHDAQGCSLRNRADRRPGPVPFPIPDRQGGHTGASEDEFPRHSHKPRRVSN